MQDFRNQLYSRWVLIVGLLFLKNWIVSSICVESTNAIYDSLPDIKSLIGADIDDDGDVDLIATSPTLNSLFWFKNNNGTFEYSLIASVTSPYSVCTGDFDGDGNLDVAVSVGYTPVFVYWYQNINGDGSAWNEMYGYQMDSPFFKVICGDVDNDGNDDIVSFNYFGSTVYYLDNINGDGSTFDSIEIASEKYISSVGFSDFDNDGFNEFLVQTYRRGLFLYDNDGSGWTETQIFSGSEYKGVSSIVTADINNDGDEDFVIASHLSKVLVWFENIGASFVPHTIDSNRPFAFIYVSDVNGDGYLDVTAATNGAIMVYENIDGSGLNWDGSKIELAAQSLVVEDLDGDGYSDIASIGFYFLSWLEMNYNMVCDEPEFP